MTASVATHKEAHDRMEEPVGSPSPGTTPPSRSSPTDHDHPEDGHGSPARTPSRPSPSRSSSPRESCDTPPRRLPRRVGPQRRLPRRRDDLSCLLAGCPGAAPWDTMEASGRAGRSGATSALMIPGEGDVMRPYVAPGSIVRRIWGDADTILLRLRRVGGRVRPEPGRRLALLHRQAARRPARAALLHRPVRPGHRLRRRGHGPQEPRTASGPPTRPSSGAGARRSPPGRTGTCSTCSSTTRSGPSSCSIAP